MEHNPIEWVGAPCGSHGPYTFYKAFTFRPCCGGGGAVPTAVSPLEAGPASVPAWPTAGPGEEGPHRVSSRRRRCADDEGRPGAPRVLALGEFFALRWAPGEPACLAELQLLWEDSGRGEMLSSSRLYFQPEDTAGGRAAEHGQDELLAVSEKVVLRLRDLVRWASGVELPPWAGGPSPGTRDAPSPRGAHCQGLASTRGTPAVCGLDFGDVEKERAQLGDCYCPAALILGFPQYCRYRALLKRLHEPGKALSDPTALALWGLGVLGPPPASSPPTSPLQPPQFPMVKSGASVRVFFCRETFEHPGLVEDVSVCLDYAPNLKGRPRKRRARFGRSDSRCRRDSRSSTEEQETKAKVKSELKNHTCADGPTRPRAASKSGAGGGSSARTGAGDGASKPKAGGACPPAGGATVAAPAAAAATAAALSPAATPTAGAASPGEGATNSAARVAATTSAASSATVVTAAVAATAAAAVAGGAQGKGEKTAEEENFLRELHAFMRTRKTPIGRIPNLGFKQVDLWVMFRAVQELGGYEAVTSQRLWKQIYDTLGGNRGSTSAATCTRRHYERLILPYERHVKGEEDKPLPPPVKPRKRSDASSSSSSGDKKKQQQQSEEEEEGETTMTPDEKEERLRRLEAEAGNAVAAPAGAAVRRESADGAVKRPSAMVLKDKEVKRESVELATRALHPDSKEDSPSAVPLVSGLVIPELKKESASILKDDWLQSVLKRQAGAGEQRVLAVGHAVPGLLQARTVQGHLGHFVNNIIMSQFSDFGPARCATDAGSAAREGQPQAADDGGPELSSLAAEGGPAKNGGDGRDRTAAPSPQPVAGAGGGGGGNGGGPGAMSPLARKKLLAQVSAMKPVGAAPPLALRGGGAADAPDAPSPPSPLNVAASSGKRPTVIQHVHLGTSAGREADEMPGFDPALSSKEVSRLTEFYGKHFTLPYLAHPFNAAVTAALSAESARHDADARDSLRHSPRCRGEQEASRRRPELDDRLPSSPPALLRSPPRTARGPVAGAPAEPCGDDEQPTDLSLRKPVTPQKLAAGTKPEAAARPKPPPPAPSPAMDASKVKGHPVPEFLKAMPFASFPLISHAFFDLNRLCGGIASKQQQQQQSQPGVATGTGPVFLDKTVAARQQQNAEQPPSAGATSPRKRTASDGGGGGGGSGDAPSKKLKTEGEAPSSAVAPQFYLSPFSMALLPQTKAAVGDASGGWRRRHRDLLRHPRRAPATRADPRAAPEGARRGHPHPAAQPFPGAGHFPGAAAAAAGTRAAAGGVRARGPVALVTVGGVVVLVLFLLLHVLVHLLVHLLVAYAVARVGVVRGDSAPQPTGLRRHGALSAHLPQRQDVREQRAWPGRAGRRAREWGAGGSLGGRCAVR
ncbi:LOW QUALITY PROTEIN: uncharacterized protein LOC144721523 [Lampetra planeri]